MVMRVTKELSGSALVGCNPRIVPGICGINEIKGPKTAA
jgi:hypothetical protein